MTAVTFRARAQPALSARVDVDSDPGLLARYLEDAAHYPGGHAAGVCRPRTIEEVSACVRTGWRILPVGAQSSLPGGATPFGEIVLSTEHLTSIALDGDRVRVGAGVSMQALHDASARQWFPPVPTFLGACAGGVAA